jgi:hypothetical protein
MRRARGARRARRARTCRGMLFGPVDQLLYQIYQKLKRANGLCIWRSMSKWLLDLLVYSWIVGHIR